VVASKYPDGHPVADGPCEPGGPYCAISACDTENTGPLTILARLELTAYELVDGIPNGKKIFIINYYGNCAFTVIYGGPCGPGEPDTAYSANDAEIGILSVVNA
jgi:hypothetical protein